MAVLAWSIHNLATADPVKAELFSLIHVLFTVPYSQIAVKRHGIFALNSPRGSRAGQFSNVQKTTPYYPLSSIFGCGLATLRLFAAIPDQKQRPVTDAKEVGVGNPAEEKTFCHRTNSGFSGAQVGAQAFSRFF
jgi:hypothetical protein